MAEATVDDKGRTLGAHHPMTEHHISLAELPQDNRRGYFRAGVGTDATSADWVYFTADRGAFRAALVNACLELWTRHPGRHIYLNIRAPLGQAEDGTDAAANWCGLQNPATGNTVALCPGFKFDDAGTTYDWLCRQVGMAEAINVLCSDLATEATRPD